jgi:hypothetical protein
MRLRQLPILTAVLRVAVVVLWPAVMVAQPILRPQEPEPARVRPFITDDARVVGAGLSQIEAWSRSDRETAQFWLLGATGPTSRLELTLGGVVGVERDVVAAKEPTAGRLTYALPLLQGKALLRPYEPGRGPGLALVGGTFLPQGRGFLKLPGYGTFAFGVVTQALAREWSATERAPDPPLFHVNVGVNRLWVGDAPDETVATWGVGTQFHVAAGAHVVGELFSGDPYVPGSGTAWQGGVRQFLSERLQLDATMGRGVGGSNPLPLWWSAGVRILVGSGRGHGADTHRRTLR